VLFSRSLSTLFEGGRWQTIGRSFPHLASEKGKGEERGELRPLFSVRNEHRQIAITREGEERRVLCFVLIDPPK